MFTQKVMFVWVLSILIISIQYQILQIKETIQIRFRIVQTQASAFCTSTVPNSNYTVSIRSQPLIREWIQLHSLVNAVSLTSSHCIVDTRCTSSQRDRLFPSTLLKNSKDAFRVLACRGFSTNRRISILKSSSSGLSSSKQSLFHVLVFLRTRIT